MATYRTKKLHTFKLLTYIVWGDFPGRTVIRPGVIKVRTTAVAGRLRVDNKDVKAYIKDLETLGLVSDLILGHGYFYVTVKEPKLWD